MESAIKEKVTSNKLIKRLLHREIKTQKMLIYEWLILLTFSVLIIFGVSIYLSTSIWLTSTCVFALSIICARAVSEHLTNLKREKYLLKKINVSEKIKDSKFTFNDIEKLENKANERRKKMRMAYLKEERKILKEDLKNTRKNIASLKANLMKKFNKVIETLDSLKDKELIEDLYLQLDYIYSISDYRNKKETLEFLDEYFELKTRLESILFSGRNKKDLS